MAKVKNPVDTELEETLNNEERNETQAPQEEAHAPEPTPVVNTRTKNVRIRVVEDVDCIVAQKRYTYKKGVDAAVPTDVAAILSNSKKAYRL